MFPQSTPVFKWNTMFCLPDRVALLVQYSPVFSSTISQSPFLCVLFFAPSDKMSESISNPSQISSYPHQLALRGLLVAIKSWLCLGFDLQFTFYLGLSLWYLFSNVLEWLRDGWKLAPLPYTAPAQPPSADRDRGSHLRQLPTLINAHKF